MEQQELWPGAGLWLDFADIESRAIDFMGDIVAHLEPMTTPERITWLKRFLIEYPDIVSASAFRRLGEPTGPDRPAFSIYAEVAAECIRSFEDSIRRRLEKEQALSDLQASGEPVPPADVEDAPAPGEWTNEQKAVALYALLRAAGLPDKHNKTAMARFAHLLTGRSKDKMKKAIYEAGGGTFGDAGAKAVIEQFEQMGLAKLAAAVRDKDFTKL